MKKIRLFMAVVLAGLGLNSCTMGLDDQPAFDQNAITGVKFESRVVELRDVTITINGVTEVIQEEVVVFKTVNATPTITADDKLVVVAVAESVDINNMVCTASISPGAKLTPLNGAPRLGVVGDYSMDRQYKVTAANKKNSSVWTIRVVRK